MAVAGGGKPKGALCFVLVALASACGKTSEAPAGNPSSSGGASSTAGSVGTAPPFIDAAGAASDAGAGIAGNLGGSGAPVASAGSGGGGASILSALDTDDATLEAASGAELLALAMQLGYARGWALCTCVPEQPLSENDLQGCAEEESTFHQYFERPARAECLIEKAKAVPGFDETLRCRARALRTGGRALAACAQGRATREGDTGVCPSHPEAEALLGTGEGCSDAFVCGDGRRFDEGHCDQQLDCEDGADERGCRNFKCGDKLVEGDYACDPEWCGIVFDPPLCSEDGAHLPCGDGQEVWSFQICDGTPDCATGRDEEYCL